jgi:transposase
LLAEVLAQPERYPLSGLFRETLLEIAERLRFFDQRIEAYDLRIEQVFRHDKRCQRLAKIAGVGPLVATAVVAAVGNAQEFKKWAATLRLAGVSAAPVLERQSQPVARHQQAW